MKKVLVFSALALVTMYFIPQMWYALLALFMLLVLLAILLFCLALVAKGLGLAGLEVWIAHKILRKRKGA